MKWLFLHRQGAAPVKTQVLSILEPYLDTPLIREAQPLRLSGPDESGFSAQGCILHLAGRTDHILVAADPTVERAAEGAAGPPVRFAGRFGFVSERAGELLSMVLVGGTTLAFGDFRLRLDSPEYRARITHLDRATERITVSPAPPDAAKLVGATIFIGGPFRRSAYKVLAANAVPGGAELRLDLDSRIGTGRVVGTEAFRVLTATPFPLHRYRYYHGARHVNAAGTAEHRLLDIRDKTAAILDPGTSPNAGAATLAREFPVGSWFDVYDYGAGDEVTWPYTVSLVRVSEGVYRLTAPIPVQVGLPRGSRTERRDSTTNRADRP
jgi:hypothetical protein